MSVVDFNVLKEKIGLIFDWDLHQKFNGKNKGFVKESKYFKIKK